MYITYFSVIYSIDYSSIILPQSSTYTMFNGYFREDANGKYYKRYNTNISDPEYVTFDNQEVLNANIGDNYFTDNCFSTNYPINYITTMTISGQNAKVLLAGVDFNRGSAVEGVGITQLYSHFFFSSGYLSCLSKTYCYTKQGQTATFFNLTYVSPVLPLLNCNSFPNANRSLATNNFNINQINIFPNPVKNSLNITNKNNFEISSISIYNTLGQLVQTITNPTNTNDVAGLKTGTYFIKMVSDKGVTSSKFMKE
jgi:hypothetical protein